jgi:hypothetical protein
MSSIRFTQNWNNKLLCDVFTTIRIYNPDKYVVGQKDKQPYENYLGTAKLIDAKSFKLENITEGMALIDTALNREACIAMMRKMYAAQLREKPDMLFGFYTLHMPVAMRNKESPDYLFGKWFDRFAKLKDEAAVK